MKEQLFDDNILCFKQFWGTELSLWTFQKCLYSWLPIVCGRAVNEETTCMPFVGELNTAMIYYNTAMFSQNLLSPPHWLETCVFFPYGAEAASFLLTTWILKGTGVQVECYQQRRRHSLPSRWWRRSTHCAMVLGSFPSWINDLNQRRHLQVSFASEPPRGVSPGSWSQVSHLNNRLPCSLIIHWTTSPGLHQPLWTAEPSSYSLFPAERLWVSLCGQHLFATIRER